MFKRATAFLSIWIVAISATWLLYLIYPTSADVSKYLKMREAGKVTAQVKPQEDSRQWRSGVRKDLWLSQLEGGRLHYRIDSASSTLTLTPNEEKFDIFENLSHLKCWMQDKLYLQGETPMQQVRFFVADEGVYRFSMQEFTAKSVELSLFRVPANSFFTNLDPSSAFMQGVAQGVSFAIAGNKPKFQADHFRAKLQGGGP
jgi:hypothetical protein